MIYGYVKVVNDNHTAHQKDVIERYCTDNNLQIDIWIEEKSVDLANMSKGDILICSDIAKLGKNLMMIMNFLCNCMKKGIKVWTVYENYRIGNDLNNKILIYAFNLSAEIERNLISNRTKQALAKKKAEGYKLGRPKSDIPYPKKLDGREEDILLLFNNGLNMSEIAQRLHVSRTTLYTHLKRKRITIPSLKRGRRKKR